MLLSQLNILATISSIDSKLLRLSGEVFLYNASAIAWRYILIFSCSSESIYTWVMVIYLLSIMPSTWQGNYFSIYTHCKTGMLPILCDLSWERCVSDTDWFTPNRKSRIPARQVLSMAMKYLFTMPTILRITSSLVNELSEDCIGQKRNIWLTVTWMVQQISEGKVSSSGFAGVSRGSLTAPRRINLLKLERKCEEARIYPVS